MEYNEYKDVINAAMLDYMDRGGSLYRIPLVVTEYIFEYEKENISYEEKKKLEDKAIMCIKKREKLPKGIKLIKVIYHDKRKGI